ncbi:MAG TPA: LamG-like jellyroll fold domain-containing protein, partial [archaeon]|nr:LamG-like jellyroll fold domain-containing protein [archaeon]
YDANLIIGQWSSGSYFWRGGIDEVRVYNRALSAGDVNQLYFCQPPSVSGIDWVIDGNTTCELGTNYDQNLVGQWKFDEGRGTTAKDFSGNGNSGTINGATHQTGKFGGALQFDGTDDYVSTTYTKSSGDGSVSAWFKGGTQSSDAGSAIRPIIAHGALNGSGTGEGLMISMLRNGRPDHGQLIVQWGDGSQQAITSSAYNDNAWHNAVLTHTSTTYTLYVDGVLNLTGTAADSLSTSPAFEVGGSTTNSARRFLGTIDDIRIYNRALSATDVNNLYKDTMVARVGNNFDLRNGSLTVLSSSAVELQPTKKAILRIKPTNRHQLIIQKLGRLIIRKN